MASEFDFQTVLETCGVQEDCVQKKRSEKEESDAEFQQEFEAYTKLKQEWKEDTDNLEKLKLAHMKNLQKIEISSVKHDAIKEEIDQGLLAGISGVNSDLQNQSDSFVSTIKSMGEDLEKLKSKFDDQNLSDLITELTSNLYQYQAAESQLRKDYQSTNVPVEEVKVCEQKETVAPMYEFNSETGELELAEAKKKIYQKEKNIRFLSNE